MRRKEGRKEDPKTREGGYKEEKDIKRRRRVQFKERTKEFKSREVEEEYGLGQLSCCFLFQRSMQFIKSRFQRRVRGI